MLYARYIALRASHLLPPVTERRLRRELRKLNLSSEAIRFARSYLLHT